MGAPPDVLESLRQRLAQQAKQTDFAVWPEHWHALVLFRALATQWRMHPAGYPCGLVYTSIPIVQPRIHSHVDAAHRQDADTLFDQLQILEMAALESWIQLRAEQAPGG
jgi:hypothetical protein